MRITLFVPVSSFAPGTYRRHAAGDPAPDRRRLCNGRGVDVQAHVLGLPRRQHDFVLPAPELGSRAGTRSVEHTEGAGKAGAQIAEGCVERRVARAAARAVPHVQDAGTARCVIANQCLCRPRLILRRPDEQQRAVGVVDDDALVASDDRVPWCRPGEPVIVSARWRFDVVGDHIHAAGGEVMCPVPHAGAQLDHPAGRTDGDLIQRGVSGNGKAVVAEDGVLPVGIGRAAHGRDPVGHGPVRTSLLRLHDEPPFNQRWPSPLGGHESLIAALGRQRRRRSHQARRRQRRPRRSLRRSVVSPPIVPH